MGTAQASSPNPCSISPLRLRYQRARSHGTGTLDEQSLTLIHPSTMHLRQGQGAVPLLLFIATLQLALQHYLAGEWEEVTASVSSSMGCLEASSPHIPQGSMSEGFG